MSKQITCKPTDGDGWPSMVIPGAPSTPPKANTHHRSHAALSFISQEDPQRGTTSAHRIARGHASGLRTSTGHSASSLSSMLSGTVLSSTEWRSCHA